MYYEVKSKIVQQDEKLLKESYLVNATSVSDAESIVASDLAKLGYNYTIESVKETKYEEVFEGTKEKYYAVVVGYVDIDEKSGECKITNHKVVVPAVDFADAYKTFLVGMEHSMADYQIISISETKIATIYEQD